MILIAKMFTLYNIRSQCQGTVLKGIMNMFHQSLKSNKCFDYVRCLSQKKGDATNEGTTGIDTSPFSTLEKYRIFKDEDSPVILDVVEERFRALQHIVQPEDEYYGLNLHRGNEGVFDIEDLVELLRRERANNIFVVKISKEFKYVDYVVIVSGKSIRQMKALAEFVRKVYKKKRSSRDLIPRIEGEDSKHWMALDLGNIALHIFSETARLSYDLEALWSLGAEFDELSQQQEDPLMELLQKHSIYLGDLHPANNK